MVMIRFIFKKSYGGIFYHMILIIILLLCKVEGYAQAQINANQMYDLDTILFLPELCNMNAGTEGMTVASFEDEILICYYNRDLHGDTLKFIHYNLSNYQPTYYSKIIAGLGKVLANTNIYSLAFNEKFIGIITFEKIIYFERNGSEINKYEFLENTRNDFYDRIDFLNTENVLLSRCYNYYNPEVPNFANVKLCLFDLNTKKLKKCIEPHLSNIALTHIEPTQFIAVSNKNIVFGSNANYKFEVYDCELNHIATQTRLFKDWNGIDSNELNILNNKNRTNSSKVMNYLHPKFISGYAFCDYYTLVNEKTLSVQYTLGNNSTDTLTRFIDVWRKHDDVWQLSDTTYKAEVIYGTKNNKVITKFNYDTNLEWFMISNHTHNHRVFYFKGSGVYPVGLTNAEYLELNRNYFIKNDPIINLVILKRKY